jgi:hypothetical protein
MQTIHLHGVPAGGLVGLKPQLSKKQKKKKKRRQKDILKNFSGRKEYMTRKEFWFLWGFSERNLQSPFDMLAASKCCYSSWLSRTIHGGGQNAKLALQRCS